MARRIRSVKPEWLEDERLGLASSDARVLSIALMLMADDEGRGRASPIMLGGQVFPGLANPREVSARALEELRTLDFVVLYEVDGQHYFEIRNWEKHQKIDRPTPSKLPKNPQASGALANPRESSRDIENPRASRASTPIPSLPDPEGVQGEPEPVCDGIRDDDTETVCPLDLAERWTGADLMADKLKVPRAEVDRVVTEFVTYWTIGGGTGKRRKHWARLLRQRVAEQVRAGGGPKLSPRAGQPLAALRSIVVED